MRILHGLNDNPDKMVKLVGKAVFQTPRYGRYNGQFGLVVFTDNNDRPSLGNKLAKFIKQHRLGRVTRSRYVTNPNSFYKIATWQWEVDRAAVEAYGGFNANL